MNDEDAPMSATMFIWLLDDLIKHARDRGLSAEVVAIALEGAAVAQRQGLS